MTTAYKTLFEIDIRHDYFLNKDETSFANLSANDQEKYLSKYDIHKVFSIIPTQETQAKLKGHQMLVVKKVTGFKVLVKVDNTNPNQAFNTPDIGTNWTFALLLKDSFFNNYTALRLKPSFHEDAQKNAVRRVYYWSNVSYVGSNPLLPTLSSAAPNFEATTYQMGDLVIHNAVLYEAIKNNNGSTTPDLDTINWKATDNLSYVSMSDELRFRPTSFDYIFTEADIDGTVEILNRTGTVLFEKEIKSEDDNFTDQVFLKDFKEGRYRLKVNDGIAYSDSHDFYYNPKLYALNVFGIIDIFHENGLGVHGLITGTGNLKAPIYKLQFKNRLTKWKYKSSNTQNDLAPNGVDEPLPLTQYGLIETVQLNGNSLPNATAQMIKPDTNEIISEIYIDENLYQ